MSPKNAKLENSILAGEGNIFASATLAKELFSGEDQTTLDISKFAEQAKALLQQTKLGNNHPLVDKLTSQIHLLDVLFTRTMQMAVNQKSPELMLALMDMALKVQNNTRRTASTINELTHPKVANNYIRTETANVATNQQINYSENKLENELYTGDAYEMDRRSPCKAGRKNKSMATLAEFNGAKNR